MATCYAIRLDGAPAHRGPCRHLGPQLRLDECQSCRGRVRVKVFACTEPSIAGETTHDRCRACALYQPIAQPAETAGRMLIRFPHGFGDAVQLTIVLRHLAALHPEWTIDVETKRGLHTLFGGLARRVWVVEEGGAPAGEYDLDRTLPWWEPETCYADSPATKAERCLREIFHLAPRPALCRYQVATSADDRARAARYAAGRTLVLVHYQGTTAPAAKNLDEQIARALVGVIQAAGCVCCILDWDRRSGLLDLPGVENPARAAGLWPHGTGDGATLAALAGAAKLCIGIDSGPGHVFGATDTPTFIVWGRHHPLNYYGLSPNVTHVLRQDHARCLRGDDDARQAGLDYFARNYRHHVVRRHMRYDLPELVAARLRGEPYALHPEPAPRGPHVRRHGVWIRRRHAAADMTIVRDVLLDDCYRLGDIAPAPARVLDIGAHVGCFAAAARARWPEAEIVCVEPQRRNWPALERNARALGCRVVRAAVCGESGEARIAGTVFRGTANTGGSYVWRGEPVIAGARLDARPVRAITIGALLHELGWKTLDLLKLDCEGCEQDVLGIFDTACARWIVGEWHHRARFDAAAARWRSAGWRLEVLRDAEPGLFRLRPR